MVTHEMRFVGYYNNVDSKVGTGENGTFLRFLLARCTNQPCSNMPDEKYQAGSPGLAASF